MFSAMKLARLSSSTSKINTSETCNSIEMPEIDWYYHAGNLYEIDDKIDVIKVEFIGKESDQ